ncbi:hypothetical protein N9Z11_01365, partial [Mariniblastus sp.]|nr:hypothetical protein [Mariniblastus sp.]
MSAFDETDDLHRAATFGAFQWIEFVDSLDQPRPRGNRTHVETETTRRERWGFGWASIAVRSTGIFFELDPALAQEIAILIAGQAGARNLHEREDWRTWSAHEKTEAYNKP